MSHYSADRSCGSCVEVEHPSKSLSASNGPVPPASLIRCQQRVLASLVWPLAMIQVDNATPIVPSLEKFVIGGTHGSVGSVTVYEALTKGGDAICRCGFDEQRNDRSLEVPAWIFEPAACDQLRLGDTPFVDCQALIELKTALQTALRADVLQAQHHSLTTPPRCQDS